MRSCQVSCPKLEQKSGSSKKLDAAPDPNDGSRSPKRSVILNDHRSSSRHLKSVQIAEVTSVEDKSFQDAEKSFAESTNRRAGRETGSPRIQKVEKKGSFDNKTTSGTVTGSGTRRNQESQPSTRNSNRMPAMRRNPQTTGRRESPDWDASGHNPCDSNCPKAKAKALAARKAQLRQERLDSYLLTKGFSYFDDVCTCSSICLINQLWRDKFVLDFFKSACLFGIGIKLCDELDAWRIIG